MKVVNLDRSPIFGHGDVGSSKVSATTAIASIDPATLVRVGASQLAATTVTSGTGTFVCVASYKNDYTALSASCT